MFPHCTASQTLENNAGAHEPGIGRILEQWFNGYPGRQGLQSLFVLITCTGSDLADW